MPGWSSPKSARESLALLFFTDIFLFLAFNRQPRPEAGEMCKDAESIEVLVLSLLISEAAVSLPMKDQEPI